MPYLDLDGGRIWYEDAGGSGLPVVLVHGIIGNSDGWNAQLPAFAAAGFRWIRYDLRSSGRSRPAAGHEGASTIASDLEAVVSHLALASFFLVGQAYGAFGALEYAIETPAKLKALVVSCSMGGIQDSGFEDRRARLVAETSVEERELGATYRAGDPEGVRRFLAIEAQNQPPPMRQSLREPMTLERLESIRVPTLFLSGDEDVFAPPPLMRMMADRVEGARLEVIAGAGHCAYWEQPDAWNRSVIGFLKEFASPQAKDL